LEINFVAKPPLINFPIILWDIERYTNFACSPSPLNAFYVPSQKDSAPLFLLGITLDKRIGFILFGSASTFITSLLILLGAYFTAPSVAGWTAASFFVTAILATVLFAVLAGVMIAAIEYLPVPRFYTSNMYSAFLAISLLNFVAISIWNLFAAEVLYNASGLLIVNQIINIILALIVTAVLLYLLRSYAKKTFRS
jgi:hypothetical protein